jgi:hypothetical protein
MTVVFSNLEKVQIESPSAQPSPTPAEGSPKAEARPVPGSSAPAGTSVIETRLRPERAAHAADSRVAGS